MEDVQELIGMLPEAARSSFAERDGGVAINLPSWVGLFGRGGGMSPGWLDFDRGEERGPHTAVHVAAVERFLASQREAGDAIVAALAAALPRIQDLYAEWEENAAMLAVGGPAEIARSVEPTSIYVHDVDGQGLIGVALESAWDNEHGLGILMRGTTVLAVNTADAAFVGWMARQACEGKLRGLYDVA